MSSAAPAAAMASPIAAPPPPAKVPAPTATRFLATLPEAKLILKEKDVSVYREALSAWVVLDMQGRPVNVLNLELIAQVNKVFEELEKLAKAKQINVVVFTSGKHNSFVAGADIHAMYPNTDQQGVLVSARALQAVFERLSKLPVPTVAAVNGAAMGGGLELALACDYRVCGDHKSVQLGLPEVKIGLLPAAGGCVRLPRVIGLQQALQVILPGGAVRADKAKKIKLVDEVIGSEDRLPGEYRFWSGVRAFATRVSDKRPRRSNEFAVQPNASFQDRLLEGTRLGRVLIGHMAAKNLDKQSKGKYPAPYQALDVVLNSVAAPHEQGLENEAQGISRLGVTPQAKALQSLFLMTEDAEKYSKHIKDGKPLSVQRVGVIGAGVMGAQIATIAAGKGLRVYMRDIKDEFVQKGLKHVQDHFNGLVRRKRMSAEDAKKRIALVEGGTSLQGFARCDLLIEAAVERMDLKKKILQECEAVIPAHCVFATNTSSLSITDLASAGSRPQNVVGLHFFNPVAKMPLVEVIKGPKTSPDSLATAYQLALRLGKIPVICGDGPGFVVNRILGIYMNEAGKMLLEGASVTDIDSALLAFGMPMGPFRLMDEVGLDVAAHVAPVLEAGLGERFKQIPEYTKALQSNPSVLGKKTGQGFYLYEDGKQKGLNSALQDQLGALVKPTGKALSRQDIADRAVFVMLNEAAAILHEGLVARPADLDLAMVMGTGFAPFTGGLFAHADQIGTARVVSRLTELEKQFGPRFAPHPRLKDMAQAGTRFFPERPDPAKLKALTSNPRSKL